MSYGLVKQGRQALTAFKGALPTKRTLLPGDKTRRSYETTISFIAMRHQWRMWSILYSINLSDLLELKVVGIVITHRQSDLLEISMKNTMRNTLLVTVAATALIAGAGLASAQGPGEAPGAATHEPKAPGGKMDQQPNGAPQKSPAPNAQAPMKPAPTAQAPAKETPAPTAQAPMKDKPTPTAQAPMKEKPAETAQAPSVAKPQGAEHGGDAQTSEPPNSRMAPGTARDETKSGPPAALSPEQHVKIRNTLRIEKSERLASVPFSTKVGEAIPGTVHLYVLPVSILEYAPQYRGYEYILVGDEILIVDPRTHRIVAVIDA